MHIAEWLWAFWAQTYRLRWATWPVVAALSCQYLGTDQVSLCFFETCNEQGGFYEGATSLNLEIAFINSVRTTSMR